MAHPFDCWGTLRIVGTPDVLGRTMSQQRISVYRYLVSSYHRAGIRLTRNKDVLLPCVSPTRRGVGFDGHIQSGLLMRSAEVGTVESEFGSCRDACSEERGRCAGNGVIKSRDNWDKGHNRETRGMTETQSLHMQLCSGNCHLVTLVLPKR